MNPEQTSAFSRRKLIAGVGALGAGVLVTARVGEARTAPPTQGSTATGTSRTGRPAAYQEVLDLQIAQFAAGLEVLAVGAYQATLDAATAGALGDVPPAVAEFATVAGEHHQAHLDAWNGVLSGAGLQPVTAPDPTLKPVVDEAFADVSDVVGAAELALMLEQIAAATYLDAQGALTDPAAIQLAGSIQVVDAQHVAVLLFVLGQYPVPDTFAKVDQSAWPSAGGTGGGSMPATK